MTTDTPRIERMYLEILLGITKQDSLLKPLSASEVAAWGRIEKQVKEIRAMGGEFEIPNEIPQSSPVKMVEK
jgi:hypothetical protein